MQNLQLTFNKSLNGTNDIPFEIHSHYTDQYLALFIFRLFFDLGFIAQGQSFRLTLFMVLIINACKTFWIEDIKEELFKLVITLNDQIKYSSPKKNVGSTQRRVLKNICSEDDLRSRIFVTFVVKFLACLPLLGFSNPSKMV